MLLRRYYRVNFFKWGLRYTQSSSNLQRNEDELAHLHNFFDINKVKAKYISIKYPFIEKLNDVQIKELIDTLYLLGYRKEALVEEPLLFSVLPITLKYRHKVLQECGVSNITTSHLASYLTFVKQKTIGELKKTEEIPEVLNVENRLASYMTQWPTSLTTLINDDVNKYTLFMLRLKIIQRYLELVLDLREEEFYRGLQTYPTIKHRPLEVINEALSILQSVVMVPAEKIKANLYLIHTDPDNLKQIIYNFQSIGGIDIKEIIRLHPKIATKNVNSLIEIRNVLQKYGISNEAQAKCFDIYTLAPSTIRERLEKAKTVPEFNTLFSHPRFLKMIYSNKTALKRLHNINKKCLSLNVLSGSSARYEMYEKAPGDRFGKGKDLIFCISQCLGKSYSSCQIRNIIKRHPFWINIPLVQIKYVHQQLSTEFTSKDIYENCSILLYPWCKIKEILLLYKNENSSQDKVIEHINLSILTKSQKLSLAIYLLENNHYFSGNGVWIEEKNKHVDISSEKVKSALL